jgi:hypothetical protein
MHKQQLGTENVWDICQLMNRRKRQSFWIGAWVSNGICAAADDSCSSRTQNIDTVQTVVSSFTSQLILPFTKEQVSSIMDGTSDMKRNEAGAIVGHHEKRG